MSQDSPTQPPSDEELQQANELLQRTVDFLSRCVENPDAARDSEDPQQLIQELEELSRERFATPPPSIRRRKSA